MTAACSPGNVDKSRTKTVHAVHAVVEILDTLGRLGREELEGACWLLLLRRLGEFGRDVHGELKGRTDDAIPGRKCPVKGVVMLWRYISRLNR